MAGAALAAVAIVLVLVLGTYVLEALLWLFAGAWIVLQFFASAVLVAVWAILDSAGARRGWRSAGRRPAF